MKTHMKIHTYRFVHVKCNECDFLAADLIDMSVHIGIAHGENFECIAYCVLFICPMYQHLTDYRYGFYNVTDASVLL